MLFLLIVIMFILYFSISQNSDGELGSDGEPIDNDGGIGHKLSHRRVKEKRIIIAMLQEELRNEESKLG